MYLVKTTIQENMIEIATSYICMVFDLPNSNIVGKIVIIRLQFKLWVLFFIGF